MGADEKIMLIGDPHFHNYKSHSQVVEGVNSRLQDVINTWEAAMKVAEERGVQRVAVTGDIFHVRGSIKPSVFNRVVKLFSNMLDEGMEIVMIPGNHDLESYSSDGAVATESFASLASEASRCVVFTGASVEEFGPYLIGGIPYIHNIVEFKRTFESLAPKCDIVLIHQGVDDFADGVGIPATGITVPYLEAHTKGWVFAGHYHTSRHKGRVVNVGAPLQHSFGDEGRDRGCWIFDGKGVEFVPLTVAPQFLTVEAERPIAPAMASGQIVRVQAKSAKAAETAIKKAYAAGAISVVAVVEKEFTAAHETPIKLSSDRRTMLHDYLGMIDGFKDRRTEIMGLFERVCLNGH